MNKTPIAIALERQIPEHIREEYSTFVQFVKAYYEFLEQTQQRNLEDIRSLDATLDDFVYKFKKELSALFPTSGLENERFLLQRIREFYKSRGSEESFKFLFRAFFNKEAEIYYPSKQILRASAGQWIQEKSIFVKANEGKSLFDVNGKIVTIITSRKHIDVYSPRVRLYRDDIYEVFIDRSYVTDISIGEEVRLNGVLYGYILPCPSKYTVIKKGSGFSVGAIYNLPSTSGNGSIVKVTKVNSVGGIEKVQIISFGLDYQTTFFAKLSNSYFQPIEYFHPVSSANIDETSPPTGFTNRDGLFPNTDFTRNSGFYGDTTTGYLEYGFVINNDYFAYQADYKGSDLTIDLDPYFAQGDYVGKIIGEFYTNALNSAIIDESVAEIMIELGSVAIYPGYYNSTDGFISDEIYIQDGKYYQLFSYVVKVEQQLDSYVDLIKGLLHPAGYELFAQYNIKNDFIVATVPLDAFVRYQFFDRQFVFDSALAKDIGLNKADITLPVIDDILAYPRDIKKYSVLWSIDNNENATLLNSTPTGSDGYLSDFGLAAQIDKNQNQTSTLKNNWDIVLGNQNPLLGTVSPLAADTYSVTGTFANRTLGSSDTIAVSKFGIDSPTPAGDNRLSNDITSLKTDIAIPVETYVDGAFRSTSGLAWSFSGDTWKDVGGQPYAYHDLSLSTAVVQGVSVPYDFKDRSLTLPKSETQLTTDNLTKLEFGKYKQPQLLGFTATLTAGSKSVTLTKGSVVNTMIGLKVVKVSGTGAFAANTIIESVDVVSGNIFTVDIAHTTSGSITFYVEASASYDFDPQIQDLAGTVTPDHGGLGWAFSGATFNKTVPVIEDLSRTVDYDRSTIPLETTSVTASHSGLTWDLTPFSASSLFNFATTGDTLNTVGFSQFDFVNAVIYQTTVTYTYTDQYGVQTGYYYTPAPRYLSYGELYAYGATFNSTGLLTNYSNRIIYLSVHGYQSTTQSKVYNTYQDILLYPNQTYQLPSVSGVMQAIGIYRIDQSGKSSVDYVTASHSALNWQFSGTTFAEGSYFGSVSNYNLKVNSNATDLMFTTATANLLLKVAANQSAANQSETLLMALFNQTEITATSQAQFDANPGAYTGYKYGDFNEDGLITSADALILLKYVQGLYDEISAAQKAKIEAVQSKVGLYNPTYLTPMFNLGLISSNAKLTTTRLFEEKTIDGVTTGTINITNSGTLYYNPYNINTDETTVSSYSSETYFVSDTRAIT